MRVSSYIRLSILLSFIFAAVVAKSFDSADHDHDSHGVGDDAVEREDVSEVGNDKPVYERPVPCEPTYLYEPFDTRAEFLRRWVNSQAKKGGAEDHLARYDGRWSVDEPRDNPIEKDLGLILKSKAKHHAISTKLDKTFEFNGKPLIVQYEVKFQSGMECGGAYIKLLSKDDELNLKTFTDKTPYTIMFGPDKCGNDYKLHFIFRHKNPKTGTFEEKHAAKPDVKLDDYFVDRKTHLFTLIINPDNSYEIKIDNVVVSAGDLLSNFSPPINPPKEIEDPDEKKPDDWDDRERIPDPFAKKPSDWDESEPATIIDQNAVMPEGWLEDEEPYIPDPSAVKPDDWNVEIDGEWEPPHIDNPKCKDAPGCGMWTQPTIENPKYKGIWTVPTIKNSNYNGEWKSKMIPNPDYFEDTNPYNMTPIDALGLELWSMTENIIFDNFIIADNATVVEKFTAITWKLKNIQERSVFSTEGWWEAIMSSTVERPWLWVVYSILLVLPILLVLICVCPESSSAKSKNIDAQKKKFDLPTPDIHDAIMEEEEDVKEEEGQVNSGSEYKGVGDGQSIGEPVAVQPWTSVERKSPFEVQVDGENDSQDTEGLLKMTGSPRKRLTTKE